MKSSRVLSGLITAISLLPAGMCHAETFFNFRTTSLGLNQEAAGQVAQGDFTISITAGPVESGAKLREFSSGLGIESRGNPLVHDDGVDKFNVLRDHTGNVVGADSMNFSFNGAGILTELDFDGVKDEAYEYFLLQTASSPDLYFFDSFENSFGGDPGLINVPGQIIFLQEGTPLIDDKSHRLAIPFKAGQVFTLTYGQLDGIQPGQLDGNGGRLQGLTITSVPEPMAWKLASAFLAIFIATCRTRPWVGTL